MYWAALQAIFLRALRSRRPATIDADASANAAGAVPQARSNPRANVVEVVISSTSPRLGRSIGRTWLTTRNASTTQNAGGAATMARTPPLTARAGPSRKPAAVMART